MDNTTNKVLKDAQYRKGFSIAFFNSTNAAIEMVKALNLGATIPHGGNLKAGKKKDAKAVQSATIEEIFRHWRDIMLEDYKKYYGEVISGGDNIFKPSDAIARLLAVKSKADLKTVWLSFSADERANVEIKQVAKEIKKKYEKA